MEDLESYLRHKWKKDIDRLAKASNSLELRYRPNAQQLDDWVCKVDNFFKMLIIRDNTKECIRWIISKIKD